MLQEYFRPYSGFGWRENTVPKNAVGALFVVVLLVFPLLTSNAYFLDIGTFFLMYGVLAVSWDLIAGYLGMLSLAHAAFFGVGGYASALLVLHAGLSPWITVPLAGLVTGLVAIPISLPAIRVKGPYVAMVTFAYAEVLILVAENWNTVTGGNTGLFGYSGLFPSLGGTASDMAYYYLALVLFALVVAVLYLLLKSRFGLVIQAIRDSEDGARALGINVNRYKLVGFTLGSATAGLAGGFNAHYIGIMSPDSMSIMFLAEIALMVVLGGMGTLFGPIVGAGLLLGLGEFFRTFGSAWRMFLFGVLIMVTILGMPRGIAHTGQRFFDRLKTVTGREDSSSE